MSTFSLSPNRRPAQPAESARRDAAPHTQPPRQSPAAVRSDAQSGAAAQPQAAAVADAPRSEEGVIARSLSIVGEIVSDGPLRIDGSLKGDVSCATLLVTESGAVEGAIRARRVIVKGTVKGQILGDTVELTETATVAADIRHQGVGIALGARFDGALIWVDDRTTLGLGAAEATKN